MAETSQPIRPQRGMVRASNRETTGGLLMSVIRSLSTSRDLADRDRERNELEKGFAQCDTKLNELVAQHNNDLYHVMNTFSRILNNLGRSKERLLDTREKLQNCEKLLHCKRDELKKLWLESVENRAVYELLERVEQVATLPKQVDSFAAKKYFLHAAQCCVDGLKQLGEDTSTNSSSGSNLPSHMKSGSKVRIGGMSRYGDSSTGALSKIEALAEVRIELIGKKESLFDAAIDELHRHLYLVSSADVRKQFHRNGSFRSSGNNQLDVPGFAFERTRKMSAADILQTNSNDLKKMMMNSNYDQSGTNQIQMGLYELSNSDTRNDDGNYDVYPEEDSRQFISMLTKCLGLLNKIPDAIEVIKERFDSELIKVVIKTTQEVLSASNMNNSSMATNSSASVTRANSFLDISSMGSDSYGESGNVNHYQHQQHNQMGDFNNSTITPNQMVLTCTSLLGHAYNGYSHLTITSTSTSSVNTQSNMDYYLNLSKMSQQLQDFFDLLIRQYRSIVSIHETIVLPNLQRIESGLHAFGDADNCDENGADESENHHRPTNFYTAGDLWNKVQSLIQQLLDYYLDSSNLGSLPLNPIGTSGNSGLSINLLFHNVSVNLGHSVTSGGVNSTNSALPVDYSSYFTKRRALAGAMNAMNVMTKNTMTAVASAATGSSSSSSTAAAAGTASATTGSTSSSTTGAASSTGASSTTVDFSSGTNMARDVNLMSSVSGQRSTTGATLFKFDHSSQAMSWNAFLNEQHQLSQQQQKKQQQQQQLVSSNGDQIESKDGSDSKDAKEIDDGSSTGQLSSSSSASVTSPSVIGKLFETLRTISTPSPDNLVIIYGILIRSIVSISSTVPPQTNTNGDECSTINSSTLQSYLLAAADKFSAHINVQLEKMLENATKSLESGVTISIAHQSPLTVAITMEEDANVDSSISKAQQNQHHFAQQQLNSKLFPPLLESVVMVDIATHDLRALMYAMPDYSHVFLGYICNVLNAFKEACNSAYENIVEPIGNNSAYSGLANSTSSYDYGHGNSSLGSTDKRVISANWAKDEDINRLLKSLPNWLSLREHHRYCGEFVTRGEPLSSVDVGGGGGSGGGESSIPSVTIGIDSNRRRLINHQISSFDESPEEIRLRNMRETEILTTNLNKVIPKHELLWQDGQFEQLAQLQESFEWMAARCDHLVSSIVSMREHGMANIMSSGNNVDHIGMESYRNLPEVYIATLNSLAKDFSDMAETCLLVMHLEVRIHCFYHLQTLDGSFFTTPAPHHDSSSSSDQRVHAQAEHFSDDPKIIPLLDDLRRMHDELQRASLKPYKMVFVFEGLDHLLSSIFINSVSAVHRIKPNGIKRSCRAIYDIQRRLAAITRTRELALDYARQYFELLLTTPEEILASIIERGPQFQSAEYVTAFTLLHHSGLAIGNAGAVGGSGGSMATGGIAGNHPSTFNMDQYLSNVDMERNLQRLNDVLNGVTVAL